MPFFLLAIGGDVISVLPFHRNEEAAMLVGDV